VGLVFEELGGRGLLVIGTYPLERRPEKIAVNIVRDADHAIFGYPPWPGGQPCR